MVSEGENKGEGEVYISLLELVLSVVARQVQNEALSLEVCTSEEQIEVGLRRAVPGELGEVVVAHFVHGGSHFGFIELDLLIESVALLNESGAELESHLVLVVGDHLQTFMWEAASTGSFIGVVAITQRARGLVHWMLPALVLQQTSRLVGHIYSVGRDSALILNSAE